MSNDNSFGGGGFGADAPDFQSMMHEASNHAELEDSTQNPVATPPAPQDNRNEPPLSSHNVNVAQGRPSMGAAPVSNVSSATPDLAGKIIRTVDVLRSLAERDREVAVQLITEGAVTENESETVIATLNASTMLHKIIKACVEAKDLDPVDRAFYIMKLERNVTQNLDALVSTFSDVEERQVTRDHLDLARQLVSSIEDLTPEHMGYVHATQSLLNAQETE